MYLIYVFILFELCLLFLNSCSIYYFCFHVFEFMYLLLFIFEFVHLLFLTFMPFYVFISRHIFCYIHFMTS